MKNFILVSLLAAGSLFAADKKAVFNFDFKSAKGLKLHRKAQVSDGTMKLSGKGDFASVPGTENVHISNKGITLIATVKLNDYGKFKAGGKIAHDMFFSKGKEFIFGRSGKVLYVNFQNTCGLHSVGKANCTDRVRYFCNFFDRFNSAHFVISEHTANENSVISND